MHIRSACISHVLLTGTAAGIKIAYRYIYLWKVYSFLYHKVSNCDHCDCNHHCQQQTQFAPREKTLTGQQLLPPNLLGTREVSDGRNISLVILFSNNCDTNRDIFLCQKAI